MGRFFEKKLGKKLLVLNFSIVLEFQPWIFASLALAPSIQVKIWEQKHEAKICYTIFKSKMKSRRQGGSDANVRGLYVEELTTMPTQIAL